MKRYFWLPALLALAATSFAADSGAAPGAGRGAPGGLRGGGGGFPGGGGISGARGPQLPPPKALYPDIKPVLTVDQVKEIKIENTTITSVTQGANGLQVTATVTHPPANDKVTVWIGLPTNWNGRFQGNGGGGWTGGSAGAINGPMGQGFAAGSTDTGHSGGSGSFGLGADGKTDMQAAIDNAYQGIHDMTVVGKSLTAAYYGKPAKYSYFVGASTGGRQGLSEAQRFPEDYDGIVSGCPAINWDRFQMGSLWGVSVQLQLNDKISQAKFRAVNQAFIAACDEVDGIKDGVVEDPQRCTFDPKTLVGKQMGDSVFTDTDAQVFAKIWEGPRAKDGTFLWYGESKGADLTALASNPLSISTDWVKYFLVKDPKWNVSSLNQDEFERLYKISRDQWGPIFGTDNPDLTKFRDHGGKIIISHGQADQLIMTQGTIDYYQHLMEKMGGRDATMKFARLFLVPAQGHGTAVGGIDGIMKWVEDGIAPDSFPNRTQSGSRPLYPYPELAKYKGTGSTDDPANFEPFMPK